MREETGLEKGSVIVFGRIVNSFEKSNIYYVLCGNVGELSYDASELQGGNGLCQTISPLILICLVGTTEGLRDSYKVLVLI